MIYSYTYKEAVIGTGTSSRYGQLLTKARQSTALSIAVSTLGDKDPTSMTVSTKYVTKNT